MKRARYLVIPLTALWCAASPAGPVEALLADLACGACHAGVPQSETMEVRAPELTDAGERYRPAYLFEYLQRPTTVRKNIGASRMPDFHLDEDESLALTLFLDRQLGSPDRAPVYPFEVEPPAEASSALGITEIRALIELRCLNCHTLNGNGGALAVDLASFSHRIREPWVRRMLAAPQRQHPGALMPDLFYVPDPRGERLEPLIPDAAEKLIALTGYLFSLGTDRRDELDRRYAAARAARPDVDSRLGETIFRSLNCAGCHAHEGIAPWKEQVGPDLSSEGDRVTRTWLGGFLRAPRAVRPFGFYPGSGSRMPDFRLSETEADRLADYLMARRRPGAPARGDETPQPLSAFAMRKAETLLRDRYSCLGCHRLGEEGGRIGPDLAGLSRRLQGSFVREMIRDPQRVVPETIMPRVELGPVSADALDLITRYLLQQQIPPDDAGYLSLARTEIHFPEGVEEGTRLYMTYCAACHGTAGDGKGYNAPYLATAPADHSDAVSMSTRTDDTLYDGMFAGGRILDKSHLMPPWGATLEDSQLRALIAHMRRTCACEGPPWSRDGR